MRNEKEILDQLKNISDELNILDMQYGRRDILDEVSEKMKILIIEERRIAKKLQELINEMIEDSK